MRTGGLRIKSFAISNLRFQIREHKPQIRNPHSAFRNRKGVLVEKQCTHLNQIKEVVPSAQGCEDCLKIGDTWLHLRLCETCGHVGCCDSSKNKHATKHFHASGHPIIKSLEPGEEWGWCYVDEIFFETL
jgi:uncharacterized UBP type Zn finger protein